VTCRHHTSWFPFGKKWVDYHTWVCSVVNVGLIVAANYLRARVWITTTTTTATTILTIITNLTNVHSVWQSPKKRIITVD